VRAIAELNPPMTPPDTTLVALAWVALLGAPVVAGTLAARSRPAPGGLGAASGDLLAQGLAAGLSLG
jgi:hypothetical protein